LTKIQQEIWDSCWHSRSENPGKKNCIIND